MNSRLSFFLPDFSLSFSFDFMVNVIRLLSLCARVMVTTAMADSEVGKCFVLELELVLTLQKLDLASFPALPNIDSYSPGDSKEEHRIGIIFLVMLFSPFSPPRRSVAGDHGP